MKMKMKRKAGFTLVEIMIVVAIIGLLAAIAIPNFVRARTTAQKNACINNLRQYDGAIQTFALEMKKAASDPYSLGDLKPYVKLDSKSELPGCPGGGRDVPGATVAEPVTCSLASAQGHAMP